MDLIARLLYVQVPSSIPAENPSTQVNVDSSPLKESGPNNICSQQWSAATCLHTHLFSIFIPIVTLFSLRRQDKVLKGLLDVQRTRFS